MGVNAYFGPLWTNTPHATPKYGPGKSKFEFDYYRQPYCSPEEVARTRKKNGKSGQEVMQFSKDFNYNFIEFGGYETCDKLISTSSKGYSNTNIISKQIIPKSNTKMTYPSATLGFCCSP